MAFTFMMSCHINLLLSEMLHFFILSQSSFILLTSGCMNGTETLSNR